MAQNVAEHVVAMLTENAASAGYREKQLQTFKKVVDQYSPATSSL